MGVRGLIDAWHDEAVVIGACWGSVMSRRRAERSERRSLLLAARGPGCSSVGLPEGNESGEHAASPVCRCGIAAIFSVVWPCLTRSKRPLQWPDLAEGRLRLDRL